MRYLWLVAGSLLPVSAAIANSECDSVLLQRNTNIIQESTYFKLAWLHLVDKGNYEEAKKASAAQVPEYFQGTYEQFESKRATLKMESRLDIATDTARSVMQSSLPADSVSEWGKCMKARGLFARVEKISPKEIQIAIHFEPPPGLNTLNEVKIDLPSFVTAKDLTDLKSMGRGSRTFVLRRKTNEEFIASINGTAGEGGQYSTAFHVPWAYELGKDEPLSQAPTVVASQGGACNAIVKYSTGNARREVILDVTTTAKSKGNGTISANIMVNGQEKCGNSASQSMNMNISARCEKIVLEANRLHTITAKQGNSNANCADSTIVLRILR